MALMSLLDYFCTSQPIETTSTTEEYINLSKVVVTAIL